MVGQILAVDHGLSVERRPGQRHRTVRISPIRQSVVPGRRPRQRHRRRQRHGNPQLDDAARGKALFFSIIAVIDDNTGCPYNNPLLTADQLAPQAAGLFSAVSKTTCTIDGVPVQGLDDPQNTLYRVQSPAFTYTVASHNNLLAAAFGEPCIPDGTTVTPAVSDGVFLMVAPLSVGQHTIHSVGVVGPVATPFFFKDITYNITVLKDSGHDDK